MLANIILGLMVSLAVPERVAILELSIEPSIKNPHYFQALFPKVLEEEISYPVIKADSFSNLMALFGCVRNNKRCLGNISLSLDVRFILFGKIKTSAEKEYLLELALFDREKEIIVSNQTTFSFDSAKEDIHSSFERLLVSNLATYFRKNGTKSLSGLDPTLSDGDRAQQVSEKKGILEKYKRSFPVLLGASGTLVGVGLLTGGAMLTQRQKVFADGEINAQERAKIRNLAIVSDAAILTGAAVLIFALTQKREREQSSTKPLNLSLNISPKTLGLTVKYTPKGTAK